MNKYKLIIFGDYWDVYLTSYKELIDDPYITYISTFRPKGLLGQLQRIHQALYRGPRHRKGRGGSDAVMTLRTGMASAIPVFLSAGNGSVVQILNCRDAARQGTGSREQEKPRAIVRRESNR